MSPVEKLIHSVSKDLHYSISDIVEKCQSIGVEITNWKLYQDIKKGKLPAMQPGGKGCDYHVRGSDFLTFVLNNLKNMNNLSN